MNVTVDVSPSNQGETLPSCLAPLMKSVGRPEWSVERLKGVMGHAFQFQMTEDGQHVMHDNLAGASRSTSSLSSPSSARSTRTRNRTSTSLFSSERPETSCAPASKRATRHWSGNR